MKFQTEYLTFNTRNHREYINITDRVGDIVRKSGVKEGMVLVVARLRARHAHYSRRLRQ